MSDQESRSRRRSDAPRKRKTTANNVKRAVDTRRAVVLQIDERGALRRPLPVPSEDSALRALAMRGERASAPRPADRSLGTRSKRLNLQTGSVRVA